MLKCLSKCYTCLCEKTNTIKDKIIQPSDILNIDLFKENCVFCHNSLYTQPCIQLDYCGHVFHYNCILKYANQLQKKKKDNFYCPFCLQGQSKLYNELKHQLSKYK